MKWISIHACDITQKYIQSIAFLARGVDIHPPSKTSVETGHVLKVVEPLYRIPESGLYWNLTYTTHQIEKIDMIRSRADPNLLCEHHAGVLAGMIIL